MSDYTELAPDQLSLWEWFGATLDIAFDEDNRQVPLHQRTQRT